VVGCGRSEDVMGGIWDY